MFELNDRQKAASDFVYGTAIVVAIPGAGKTTVMTHRIASLVKKYNISPESILSLTFTRNAAQSMKEKLKPVLEDLASRVTLSTIHSFCHSLLRQEGKVFEILHGTEQIKFIRKIMKMGKVREIPTGMILQSIGLAKNNLVTCSEFQALYEGDDTMQKIAGVYKIYEQEKRKKLLMDFNDLLVETYNLLKQEKEVRDKYWSTYTHILVDEVQDTNPAQMEILKLLIYKKNGKDSFWVCGDESQSIYGFMGASVGNILNFDKTFPKCKQYILDRNYRSTPQILNVCQSLINRNTKKIDKRLHTHNANGEEAMLLECSNEEDEALKIVNEIRDLIERKGLVHKDIAVLYRANSQSRSIEDAFTNEKIPFHIENGTSFYKRYEVKVLLDYLRLIDNPESDDGDDALKNIINIPNRYIGRKFMGDLEDFASQRGAHLYPALRIMPIDIPYLRRYVREFTGVIDPLITNTNKIEPSEMIHILREALDYDKYITDDDIPTPDDSKIENINQLQLVANKYPNIQSLLNYTDSFREEISNDKNGVSLMSIHKSKGLEFPAVFVIGLVEGILPNKQGDVEEERRVCFVAISRAMKQLYLSYSYNYMGKPVKRSTFLDEMFETK